MVTALSSLKINHGIQSDILANQTVIVIDKDFHARRRWSVELENIGFGLILTAGDLETARNYTRQYPCDLVFIDPSIGINLDEGFALIRKIRELQSDGTVAVLTGNPSTALCYRAARAGVSDFLVKGPYLSISAEATRLLKNRWMSKNVSWRPETAFATGLFSSVGVTRGELAILEEFARGFPKQQDIAKRLNKDEVYVRKVFSRVYKKLENYFPIGNQAQLSHIMTICSLFS